MKIFNKIRSISLIVTILMVGMIAKPTIVMAAQPTVKLGTTSGFAILAGTAITSTGPTEINGSVGGNVGGDVGLSPGTAFTENNKIKMSGVKHVADDEAMKAKDDLVTAYDDAAGRKTNETIGTELGGQTLTPGTYDSKDGTFGIKGTLTLDAKGDPNAVFVFKTGSTLTTESGSRVKLINGARFCRTFWKVGSSATLGTNSIFAGHIFALESITATTGAEVEGQLLARNGAVTLDNNKITNGFCEPTQDQAKLKVIKHVTNDNDGKKVASDFNLHIKKAGNDVVASPAPGNESGKSYTLAAGDYVISEDNIEGYSASYSGSDSSGKITLAPGDNKTVTITNDDIQLTPSANGSDKVEQPRGDKPTVTGGTLPDTSTHLYEVLTMGAALTLLGALGWISRKRFE
ncbi:ice-binding family protein [Clostridium sp.]|uniref:ice-binding family protein n=1 Tax=Clostridium sp. TaxID=1506 RepID=UPI003D6D5034